MATLQGHPGAAANLGDIYENGHGVAIDYARAFAAFKVGAEYEGVDDFFRITCQYMVGNLYFQGKGVDMDETLSVYWMEKAAALDHPEAVASIGFLSSVADGTKSSWRRGRQYCTRAVKLGHFESMDSLQEVIGNIQRVTRRELAKPLPHDLTSTFPPVSSRLPSHAQHAPLMDKRVEIHATSRADLNGKRGVATDFHTIDKTDPATWRYTVKLDGGEAFKLKRANVRAEGMS